MKTLLMVAMGGVAAVAMVSSCHSDSSLSRDGGADDGSAVLCSPVSGLEAEPAPRQVDVSGGVPFDQFPNALAVARCSYANRCFGLATYVANDCVDTVVADGTFTYLTCAKDGSRCSWSTALYYLAPFDQLVAKVATGEARYDASRAGPCIAALLAEPCVSRQLSEGISACAGVISCLGDPGGGSSGSTDGGATDAGPSCTTLVEEMGPLPTCTTADQCAGVANPPWPYCVGGLCAPSPCGFFPSCTAFAQVGQPCDSTLQSIVSIAPVTSPTGACAPGLTCRRTGVDAGMGTCIAPQDVGAPCTDTNDCMAGLACACGVCEIPPSSGPCADGMCHIDVAYCDFFSEQCKPVRKLDDFCGDAIQSCGPGLVCHSGDGTGTCRPPPI